MKKTALCYMVPGLVAAVIAAWPAVSPITGNEMGYCLLNYYLIFPIAALICGVVLSALLGRTRTVFRWLYPVFTGALELLMPLPVFHTASALTVGFGLAAGAVGVVAGWLFSRLVK